MPVSKTIEGKRGNGGGGVSLGKVGGGPLSEVCTNPRSDPSAGLIPGESQSRSPNLPGEFSTGPREWGSGNLICHPIAQQ